MRMRRLSIILVLLSMMLTSQAQNVQVEKICQLYASVKEAQDYRRQAELPPNEMLVNNEYMAPGAGPVKHVYHYFFSGEYNGEAGDVVYCPQFVTWKYNVGARNYYEEYLYYDDGKLAFHYEKGESFEYRHYFDVEGGLIHKAFKGNEEELEWLTPDRLLGQAETMRRSFSLLMNGK